MSKSAYSWHLLLSADLDHARCTLHRGFAVQHALPRVLAGMPKPLRGDFRAETVATQRTTPTATAANIINDANSISESRRSWPTHATTTRIAPSPKVIEGSAKKLRETSLTVRWGQISPATRYGFISLRHEFAAQRRPR